MKAPNPIRDELFMILHDLRSQRDRLTALDNANWDTLARVEKLIAATDPRRKKEGKRK